MSEPKVKIENIAGRDLGTYPGATNEEALEVYLFENGYASVELAVAQRFIALDRITFSPVPTT